MTSFLFSVLPLSFSLTPRPVYVFNLRVPPFPPLSVLPISDSLGWYRSVAASGIHSLSFQQVSLTLSLHHCLCVSPLRPLFSPVRFGRYKASGGTEYFISSESPEEVRSRLKRPGLRLRITAKLE